MIDRLSKKATELETSDAAAKRKTALWAMWFVIAMAMFSTLYYPLFGLAVRAWGRPYVIGVMIDSMRVLLVFSVVMIGVALWRVYAKLGRSRA